MDFTELNSLHKLLTACPLEHLKTYKFLQNTNGKRFNLFNSNNIFDRQTAVFNAFTRIF